MTESSPPPSSRPPRAANWKTVSGVLVIIAVTLWIGASLASYIRPVSNDELDITKRQLEQLKNSGVIDASTFQKIKQALEMEKDEPVVEMQYYTCGMHPWVVLPEPGDCLICGMDLVPLDPDKFSGEVTIDPIVVQNIGVRIALVESGPLTRRIRTVGIVDYDETRVRDINIKVPGWIEKLHVNYMGATVKQGDNLFDFYSPDLYAAQEEYLLARENLKNIGVDFIPEAARNAEKFVEDARTRLLYFDVTPDQITQLEKRNKPSKTLAVRSPYSGVVIAKHANEGMRVDPGMQVYRLADLSKVWIMVTLYEHQLPFVKVGQHAVMSLPYIPGQTFEGKVIYIYPYLDKKTREVQVRLEFDNPNRLLKPGMFTTVELQSTLAEQRTLVPRAAILDTGERKVAFVSLGGGKFEPRDVIVGVEASGGKIQILDGLEPGEQVVVSGQFLIDSEAKMRDTLMRMVRGNSAADQEVAVAVEGASELTTLPDDVAQGLSEVLDAYFSIGDQLAGDIIRDIAPLADRVAKGLSALTDMAIPDRPHFWHQHKEVSKARALAGKLAAAKDLDQARLHFADLSVALGILVKSTGIPPQYPKQVQQLHCPMYREDQGGSAWLQLAGDVRNPYFGASMLGCFDQRETLPTTAASLETKDTP